MTCPARLPLCDDLMLPPPRPALHAEKGNLVSWIRVGPELLALCHIFLASTIKRASTKGLVPRWSDNPSSVPEEGLREGTWHIPCGVYQGGVAGMERKGVFRL